MLGLIGWYGLNKIETSLGLPEHLRLTEGDEQVFRWLWPVKISGQAVNSILQIEPGPEVVFRPLKTGDSILDLSLFGVIPLRERVVSVVPKVEVVPGGESIGVMLAEHGMIVAELARLQTIDGTVVSPAGDAGLKPGDLLVQINEVVITGPLDVERALRSAGSGPVTVKVLRKGEPHLMRVYPARVRDESGQVHLRLGVYLEDTAAGVGTLSFYHPASGRYAALGHMVTDSRTGEQAIINNGRIVPALIAGIRRGSKGQPGEKIGLFQERAPSLGIITKNSSIGIFGELTNLVASNQPTLPVAMAHEVELGPAYIRTVIDGDKVEQFDVKIVKVNKQTKPGIKGMVIEITDPRLLEITGGIVQGMSGSPIIQNQKLVGVITHVFVNDPTRGYGVFAEWMVHEAGLFAQDPAAAPAA